MRLDKKGWGTLEMVLLCSGLLIALLVAVFFISRLYGSFENSISNKQYMDLESKLENAAKEYVKKNNIEITSEYKLTLDDLKDGYISNFNDTEGNACNGYVLINNLNNVNYYKGYITCNNYQTKN